jgi:hypothetical protein
LTLRTSALFAQQRQEKDLPFAKMLEALLGKRHVLVGLPQGEKSEDEGGYADRNKRSNHNQKQSLCQYPAPPSDDSSTITAVVAG